MKNKKKVIFIAIISITLSVILIILPIATAIVYESIFGARYETASWMKFSTNDYADLQMERSDFQSGKVTLAGYKYSKPGQAIKGVTVISHGLGGGGHNAYMPMIDYFTSNGYYVFAYDAHGTDNSGGDGTEGLPQGIIDLHRAIEHVKSVEEYNGLPITLFGHSWGGYSVGNVLNLNPDVRAAVIVSGMNESADLLEYQGRQMVGAGVHFLLPYIKLYERIKFGSEFACTSAIDGMAKSNAKIMIIHSKDDTTVPAKYGYDIFHSTFAHSDRFKFILYEDKGHDYIFYSDDAWEYRKNLNESYKSYVEDNGGIYNAEIKQKFMSAHLDKKQCFALDIELMKSIIEVFDKGCIKK